MILFSCVAIGSICLWYVMDYILSRLKMTMDRWKYRQRVEGDFCRICRSGTLVFDEWLQSIVCGRCRYLYSDEKGMRDRIVRVRDEAPRDKGDGK
jgi:hypothetical protein